MSSRARLVLFAALVGLLLVAGVIASLVRARL
jgi:outer membrane murein-binding lipoprotein Lpp